MTTIILGGGIAGLSLAHFLNDDSIILEKEQETGGLCRSFNLSGVYYDVGPHILFSKNQQILNFHTSLIKTNKLRRMNKVFLKGKFIKYPLENDLASLSEPDKEYCLKEFLDNPYENYDPKNMLQFFLKTFGEGITRLYLQPYNEKIWKYDPAFMDLQMVERIPKPPKEDIIKSAKGVETEGYTHQLYFHYPSEGGVKSLIKAYEKLAASKSQIVTGLKITSITKDGGYWVVESDKGAFKAPRLVNCMPLEELFKVLRLDQDLEFASVKATVEKLKYNSIHIAVCIFKKDNLGDNFAINVPDQDIIFHRVCKLNFLGENYVPKQGSALMMEITFRPESHLAYLSPEEIKSRIVDDLHKIGFIDKKDLVQMDLKTFKYAYVIYDLDHRKNADKVLNYLKGKDISCCGRFAEFEYMNTDKVAENSQRLAEELNKDLISKLKQKN